MENKFYTTTASNEVEEIKSELNSKGFSEAEPCGQANTLFIDTVNMLFWHCNEENLKANKKLALDFHKEETHHITLNEIKSWQN